MKTKPQKHSNNRKTQQGLRHEIGITSRCGDERYTSFEFISVVNHTGNCLETLERERENKIGEEEIERLTRTSIFPPSPFLSDCCVLLYPTREIVSSPTRKMKGHNPSLAHYQSHGPNLSIKLSKLRHFSKTRNKFNTS